MVAGLHALVTWSQVIVLLLPLPVIVTTNLAVAAPRPALRTLNHVLLIAIPAFVAVLGVLDALGDRRLALEGAGLVVSAAAALAVQAPAVATRVRRRLPYDPHNQVHALALVLTLLLVGTQLTTQLTTNVLVTAAAGPALSRLDLVVQEIPFLLAALLGVGVFVRRSPRAALERLGFVRPAWWQLALALSAAGAFIAFGTAMDRLGEIFTPALQHQVSAANDRLFGRLSDFGGVVTIALAAGICEEALFRGALQPRFGLLWPAVVFAAVHTQYGLSFDTAAVLILAVGLGLLRLYANTTTSALCHVAYDAAVGFGIARIGLVEAVAIEGVLLALTGVALWMHLRSTRLLTGTVGNIAPGD